MRILYYIQLQTTNMLCGNEALKVEFAILESVNVSGAHWNCVAQTDPSRFDGDGAVYKHPQSGQLVVSEEIFTEFN